VAVGLARLGVSAGFIGKVGDDPFGEFLRHTIEAEGVDVRGLRTARGARTTLAFIATRSDGRKDISFYRNPGADMLLAADEISLEYLTSGKVFHFGSVSLSRPPAREATLHAAAAAKKAGLLVSYDPNWRPSLWDDPTEARGTIWQAMPLAHVVHCAFEEWEFVTGTTDLEAGAKRILDTGPRLVVVTQGELGCYFDDGASRGQQPGYVVDVVDALGAGDAFVAAMLSRLMGMPGGLSWSREELRNTMAYANAAGALTCTKRGVIPALPTAEEVAAFQAARGAGA